jgi:hypothetical protein
MALACRLPDPAALAALHRDGGLALVLVHLRSAGIGPGIGPYACPPRPLAAGPADGPAPLDVAAWEEAARGGRKDLTLVVRDGDDLLFRVGP